MNKEFKDIPVFKTFIHLGNYFLYDTYSNRLLIITKDHYLEIDELKNVGLSTYLSRHKQSLPYNDIIWLLQKGFLKSNFIDEIEHPETKYVHDIVNRCVGDITLQVTKNCNFSCRYCSYANNNGISRNHNNQYMSWDVAKHAVDYLQRNSMDMSSVGIAFYGGEPFLNFELITKTVEYAESQFYTKKINYLITTNGSIITNEIIDFLAKYKFQMTISFDGPKDIQNNHRKFYESGVGTYDIVYDNIQKLRKRQESYFSENVLFLPVFFEDEDESIITQYFGALNINEDRLHKVVADLKGIDYSLDRHNLMSIHEIENIEVNARKQKEYVDIFSDKRLLPRKWHHNGPCIPTAQRLFINTEGKLYVCEKSMEEDYLSIGNIYNGINIDKIITFMNIGELTENECKSCWAMRFCKICLLFCNDVERKSITKEKKLLSCQQIKKDVLSFLKQYVANHIKEQGEHNV